MFSDSRTDCDAMYCQLNMVDRVYSRPNIFLPHPLYVLMIHLPYDGETKNITLPMRVGKVREERKIRMITVVTRRQVGRDSFNKKNYRFKGSL